MDSMFGAVFATLALILSLVILYQLFVAIPADMARNRGRDPFAWVLISILGSPFLSIFLLWVLGPAN